MDSFLHTLDQEKLTMLARSHLREKGLILASEGVRVRPWHSPDIPIFAALSIETQREVVSHLESQLNLLRAAKKDGISLLDSKLLLRRALEILEYTAEADVFELIDANDTIEVYSLDQRQVFRNIQFFQYVSFTLEQIHSRRWYELTTRDVKAERDVAKAAAQVLSGEVTGTLSLHSMQAHLAEEIDSEGLRRFWIQMRFVSPLKRQGVVAGLVAVNRTTAA